MTFKGIISIFVLALISFQAEAQEAVLREGANDLSISFYNNWKQEVKDLQISFDADKIPEWLTITENGENSLTIDSKTQKAIKLSFTVINAPDGASAEIPYMLTDNEGNVWNVKLSVRYDSKSSKPFPNALIGNFPNPFNPSTTINYSIDTKNPVKLVIYNSLGQVVKTLVNEIQVPGVHTVQWDGLNEKSQNVSAGIYFYRLTSGSFIQTRKMMMIE